MNSPTPPAPPRSKDEEHLRILAIFHYVVAGIGAFFACFPLFHVGLGIMMLTDPGIFGSGKGQPPPAALGYVLIAFGAAFVLLGWATAVCTFISGRFLAKRRKRMFSFVMGAILCAFMPFGTVLGIFTILVLSRESVQRLYETAADARVPVAT